MTEERERLALTAELYLCLAQAFRAPKTQEQCDGMRELLGPDLDELGAELGHDFGDVLAAYRDAVGAHDAASLLQLYSRLFLTPPMLARINAGAYLDGAELGATVAALEEIYRRCGVERLESFHDQADHVVVQLEFAAYLYACAARGEATHMSGGQFLGLFPARWLPRLARGLDCAGEHLDEPNPYAALVDVVMHAVGVDAREYQSGTGRVARTHRALEKARAKRAAHPIGRAELAEIAAKLREAGLSVDHLPML
jgi:TorA maturation chaperone TorD